MRGCIERLDAPGGVYFVLGNVDRRDDVERVFRGTNVRLLVNEIVRVDIEDRILTIGGIELDYRAPGAVETMAQLENLEGDDDIRILLTHMPDPVRSLEPGTRIDLVVAGHTHGGQVVIPFLGPPITLSRVPRRAAAGGLHDLDGRRIYISRGLGCERGYAPRIRFLCPPEVTVLTLGA